MVTLVKVNLFFIPKRSEIVRADNRDIVDNVDSVDNADNVDNADTPLL